MKRIFDKFRSLFKREKPAGTAYPNHREQSTASIPEPKESREEAQTRAYRQYRKAMRKRGQTPGSYKAWITGKHPLHSASFGTFSPIKPIARLQRISKDKVLRIA